MNKPTTPKAPDLLTPVCDAIDAMDKHQLRQLAVDMKVNPETLKMMRDPARPRGPSYQLVAELYERLVVKKAA